MVVSMPVVLVFSVGTELSEKCRLCCCCCCCDDDQEEDGEWWWYWSGDFREGLGWVWVCFSGLIVVLDGEGISVGGGGLGDFDRDRDLV